MDGAFNVDPVREYKSLGTLDSSPLLLTSDPSDYRITHVYWLQKRDVWNHQYLVIEFRLLEGTETFYIRIERDKKVWLGFGPKNLDDKFSTCASMAPLALNSFAIADFEVQNPLLGLDFLARLIQAIHRCSDTYTFLAFNCWWFAGCSFECFTHVVDHSTATANLLTGGSSLIEARRFAVEYYLCSHWPYWMLMGYAVVIVTTLSSFLTNWSFLAIAIPSILVAAWSVYYIYALAGTWHLVLRDATREEGTRPEFECVVSTRLALWSIGVAGFFLFYGILFLVMAFSPMMEIVCIGDAPPWSF